MAPRTRCCFTHFLFDSRAIRHAAGNPTGRTPLELPDLARLEDLPDPKGALRDVLSAATELPPRRRQRLWPSAFYRLAELIDDFSPLRRLPAFATLEEEINSTILEHGWSGK
jgi:hypothetical protein